MELLQSPRLSFSRDGRMLIEADASAVAIVDPDAGVVGRYAFDDVRGAVGFFDQVWIAHGRTPRLSRVSRDGHVIDCVPIADVEATLIAAPFGPAAAMWSRQLWIEEQGTLVAHPIPGELAIPLAARRWVTAHGARVCVPSGLSCTLAAEVLGGAVIRDGARAALITAGRELVVVSLGSGQPKFRQPLGDAAVRVAVRRELAAIRCEPRRIAIVDLRRGRTVGEVVISDAVTDFALDPDGERIALRGGMLEILRLGDAVSRRATPAFRRAGDAGLACGTRP